MVDFFVDQYGQGGISVAKVESEAERRWGRTKVWTKILAKFEFSRAFAMQPCLP